MTNTTLENQLAGLIEIAKTYTIKNDFMLIKDRDGWTDGYVADLLSLNVETMKAKATIKNDKKPIFRFVLDKEQCPKVENLITIKGNSESVKNLEWDLTDNNVFLVTDTKKVKVNPTYLKYFHLAYESFGGIGDILVDDSDIVKIVITGDIIGIIATMRGN